MIAACTCKVICIEHDNELTGHQIERCPVHAAAPELLGVLKTIHLADLDLKTRSEIAQAIAKAEGTK